MMKEEMPKLHVRPTQPQLLKTSFENNRVVNEQQKTANTVVITGGPNVVIANFGPESQILKCPYCYTFTSTRVKPNPSTKTHLWAALLCVCCCWLCSCCPYLIESCHDRIHYCSHCEAYLGSYRS